MHVYMDVDELRNVFSTLLYFLRGTTELIF